MRNRSPDYTIMVIVFLLVMFGMVMVFSASYYSNQSSGQDGLFFFRKQIQGALIGFAAMILLSFVDYHIYQSKFITIGSVLLSIVLLVAVLFTGEDIYGAKRWLDLGFVSFQPSEIARISIVFFAANALSKRFKLIKSSRFGDFIKGVWPVLFVAAIICTLIFIENLSMTLTVLAVIICMLIAAGTSGKSLAAIMAGGIGVGAIGIAIEPFRVQRLMIFGNPWKDPSDTGYQLVQSLYALGSGGLLGVGLGNSKQKHLYLTFGESDFILSIIGEELGFLGITILLAIFIILIWRCLMSALRAPDAFGMLLCAGLTSIIAVQVIMNVAVVTSSMPPTGVPLPFVSAGNTSLIVFMSAMGIILNISSRGKKIT